jgi:isocitrate dehydrogenase
MSSFVPVTLAFGDGIGPEIMDSVVMILKEAEAKLKFETIEIGEKLYNKNYTSGISEQAWESIARTNVIFKAPITTPQGGGYKSLNVTLRKALGLYANIRPSIAYHPFVKTQHPNLDLVIVRENEEDIYAGIEYRHTHNVYESIKLISRTGSEKIIRYAFDYAVKNNRSTVSCFSKDNIMKFSDGIFHKVFDEIAKEYPSIKNNHYIIDIGTAKIAAKPELFDVIVTSNLYGDIISDVAAEISGSVGLAGSANIGNKVAMFEAVHGSAPDIAGMDIANPSGLLNAAIMMLIHIGQSDVATLIENAWKKTIEDGIHTGDIYNKETSSKKVGTKEFARSIIERLGQHPKLLKKAEYKNDKQKIQKPQKAISISTNETKQLIGVDVFIDMKVSTAHALADKLYKIDLGIFELQTISSKGLKLWPHPDEVPVLSDHWCARFMPVGDKKEIKHKDIGNLITNLANAKIDFIKVENLFEFDGKKGYSLAQGE